MWPTILIAAVLFGVTALIIALEIRKRARGESSCSCGGNCGACNACGKGEKRE